MMTEKQAPNKRKIIDWNKKSSSDSDRFLSRSKDKDDKPKKSRPPRATGKPLLRLRKKIKEIYEEDDYEDQDDLINNPLYQINLIQDQENIIQNQEKFQKKEIEVLKISKQQELTSKLNIIMNSALAAQKANLNAEITKKDLKTADKPELTFKEVRKKTIKEKLATPLDIEDETDSIENEKDPAKLAKLVLEKSGRKKIAKKKSLMEIAQGLNRFKDFEADENAENEKD